MVQLSATRCSCIAILWVSLVSFATITLYVATQWMFIVVYFIIDSDRKLLDTALYEWIQMFKNGWPSVNDVECLGCLTISTSGDKQEYTRARSLNGWWKNNEGHCNTITYQSRFSPYNHAWHSCIPQDMCKVDAKIFDRRAQV
jgi:hypothetical protein